MDEVTLESAPQKVRDLFTKGAAALDRNNLDYAIDMFLACLELAPSFHRARKLLREAEVRLARTTPASAVTRWFRGAKGLPTLLTAQTMAKSGKALQAVPMIERVLRHNPLDVAVLKALAEAAEQAGMPEAAVQALAVARDVQPRNAEILDTLGTLYLKVGETRKARDCFEQVCALRPNDGAALKRLKDAMALDSIMKDGWAEAASGGSFRNIIRDTKEAELLEKQAKAFKGEKDTTSLIAETLLKIQREPGNINFRRALASLYANAGQFEEAIASLEEAQKVTGGRDPQVDQAIAHVRLQQFAKQIEGLLAAGRTAEAEAVEKQRDLFRFKDLEDRVQRYPNELPLRQEYGVELFNQGRINESIQQFQLSQRAPQCRTRALLLMGLAFKAKQQYDMAVEQLEKAVSELSSMDDLKKEILYELGLVHEATGNTARALECFKQVYQVDIGFKDVADKVERIYRKSGA